MAFNINKLNNSILNGFSEPLKTVLLDISKKYDIKYEELESRYCGGLKIKQRRKTNKKGRLNAYSVFLKDEVVTHQLKVQYPETTFGELSKIRGDMWNSMSTKDKNVYSEKAKKYNQEQELKAKEEVATVVEEIPKGI